LRSSPFSAILKGHACQAITASSTVSRSPCPSATATETPSWSLTLPESQASGWARSGNAVRPYLCYLVDVQSDDLVHLVLKLNDDEIVDQTLRGTSARSYTKVFGHDSLRTSNNTLKIIVPADQPGNLVISDLLVVYAVFG